MGAVGPARCRGAGDTQPRTPPGGSQSTTGGRVVPRDAAACRVCSVQALVTSHQPWSHEQVLELWGTGSEGWFVTGWEGKSPSSQGYGFSSGHVWMWELDYKEAEHRRIDAFELWCWRRFLRVPWTARRSNQSILKEISPGCSLVGLQYFGHLMRRADSLEKTLMLGKIEGRRRRGWQDEMVA